MKFKLRGYLKETRQPIYSAAMVLPFLCIYHIGTVLFHTTNINGADALIIRILSALSVHSMFASALVLAAFFTIWQLRTHAKWKIRMGTLLFCFLESVCFALILLFGFGWMTAHLSLAISVKPGIVNIILYCGAGVYEELVFRAFLLGILVAGFSLIFHMKKRSAAAAAAILGALLFALFHYIGPGRDAFSIGSFAQRTLGGLYFSVLYVTRGFGVTAASHAIYDILVGIILT